MNGANILAFLPASGPGLSLRLAQRELDLDGAHLVLRAFPPMSREDLRKKRSRLALEVSPVCSIECTDSTGALSTEYYGKLCDSRALVFPTAHSCDHCFNVSNEPYKVFQWRLVMLQGARSLSVV